MHDWSSCLSEDLAPVAYSSRAEANLKRSDNVIEEILLKSRQFVNPFFIRSIRIFT